MLVSELMDTQILHPNDSTYLACVEEIRRGGVVAFPTETVYGLGASVFDEIGIAKVFSVKERPFFDPLIAHIPMTSIPICDALINWGLLNEKNLTPHLRNQIEILAKEFWPGPLTIVIPKSKKIPDLVTAGLDTVAVRMPNHPVAQELIRRAGVPLVAPSANRFGRISPTTAEDVFLELNDRIPFILDGGIASVGIESTILFLQSNKNPIVLRPGGLSLELVSSALGCSIEKTEKVDPSRAPGRLPSHYAPVKKVILAPKPFSSCTAADWKAVADAVKHIGILGVLAIDGNPISYTELIQSQLHKKSVIKVLNSPERPVQISNTGDVFQNRSTLRESQHEIAPVEFSLAARNLFGFLRALDQSEAEIILVELPATDQGLGFAIRDRLTKSAGPR